MLNFKKAFIGIVFIGLSNVHAGSYEDFFEAFAHDQVEVVQDLLARGFDPNSVNSKGVYALIAAIQAPAPKIAAVLLDQPGIKPDVRNSRDESPLMLAALKGDLELCKRLISRDADVNKTGWTALHYAATGGFPEIAQLLIDSFAYIDAESPNGTTPLMMAAMYGNAATVKVLLDGGADPYIKNSLGMNAIDFGLKVSHMDSVELIAAAIRAAKR
jgi:ankyrin repeat protein